MSSAVPFSIVVACDKNRGIGMKGKLPWNIPEDMKWFKTLTRGEKPVDPENVVIMGRKTWQSIPEKFRPLPGRWNLVLSRSGISISGGSTRWCRSFPDALEQSWGRLCFVIGGAALYEEALKHPALEKIYLTQIDSAFPCDRFFPDWSPLGFKEKNLDQSEWNGIQVLWKELSRPQIPSG